MEGVKIVRRSCGRLYSAVIRNECMQVEYIPDVPVYPRRTFPPLCVFKNKDSAHAYVLEQQGFTLGKEHEVWACQIKKSTRKMRSTVYLPEGTILADEVCLTQKIGGLDDLRKEVEK